MIAPLLGTAVASWFSLQASFAVAGVIFLLSAAIAVALLPARVGVERREWRVESG
jgi:hypothetical protein